ncbi:AAA family ATPase [Nocardia fluminea]|uniref:AAA family ATPase n=1 Tax=Nocardia fluminea TaxID=134984 RepID=UPI003807DCBC
MTQEEKPMFMRFRFDRAAIAHGTLSAIFGRAGKGAIAAIAGCSTPGDQYNKPVGKASFFSNTLKGRRELVAWSQRNEAAGLNSFLNSAIWPASAVRAEPRALGKHNYSPLKFWCLWSDLDEKPGKAINRELLRKLMRKGCVVTHSGGVGEDGKPRMHIRVLLDAPMADADEFRHLNQWLAAALNADAKFNEYNWLTMPESQRFKPDYPDGRPVSVVKVEDEKRWSRAELEALFAEYAPEVAAPTVSTDVAANAPKPARGLLKGALYRDLRAAADNASDRSGAAFAVIKVCVRAELDIDTAAGILWHARSTERARDKYDGSEARMLGDVTRMWPKAIAAVAAEADVPQKKPKADHAEGWTLDELMRVTFPALRFIAEGLVTEGLALIVASPKTGKSFWLLELALSVAQGLPAFGSIHTAPGEVLYLNLEGGGGRSIQSRVKVLAASGAPKPIHQIHFKTEWDSMNDGGIEALDEWLTEHPDCTLVVVDTLAAFKGEPRSKSSDPFAADYGPAKQLSDLAHKHRCAIAVAHHDRKAESDDFVDSISGTKGLTAAADVLIVLRRTRNKPEGRMLLVAREMEGNDWNVLFEDGRWRIADEIELEEAKGTAKGKVLKALGFDALTAHEVHTRIIEAGEQMSPGNVSTTLSRLRDDGLVVRKGNTYSRA